MIQVSQNSAVTSADLKYIARLGQDLAQGAREGGVDRPNAFNPRRSYPYGMPAAPLPDGNDARNSIMSLPGRALELQQLLCLDPGVIHGPDNQI